MNDPEASKTLSARIRRTLDDLTAIRQSLLAHSEPSGQDAWLDGMPLDLELAGELKSVVDALRQLL